MAGNIPLVGFHDLMCVLLSGHHLIAKLSSNDSVLMKFIRDLLINIDPSFKSTIFFEERLNGVDAVIATGSDNTSRYFEYYFRNIPHIIRKNRTSCAVILGEESADEFSTLGKDVFSYFQKHAISNPYLRPYQVGAIREFENTLQAGRRQIF